MTDAEIQKFVKALVRLCQEFNLAFQNTQVLRKAKGRIAPRGLPKDLTQNHPDFAKRFIKLCQKHAVQLPRGCFVRPHEDGMNWVTLAFDGS